jgi:Cupredoxin-like domain
MAIMIRNAFNKAGLLLVAAMFVAGGAAGAHAQDTVALTISIKLRAPAGKAITLTVKNLDPIAAEFESKELHVEKVIAANGQGVVRIRAQKVGRYNFFDDFHQDTQGTLVVE